MAQVKTIPAKSYILINGGIPVGSKHIADPNPPITYGELAKAFVAILASYGGLQTGGSSKQKKLKATCIIYYELLQKIFTTK